MKIPNNIHQADLLKPKYTFHHQASERGYVSRKGNGIMIPYKGKFGEGFKVLMPRWDTSQYVAVNYWIKN
jgi:hypothetical protein